MSAEGTRRYGNVRRAALPAFSGEMQVLSGHAETFMLLRKGSIRLERATGGTERIDINGGECHVRDGELVVIL